MIVIIAGNATSMTANTRTRESGANYAGLGGPIPYVDVTNPTTAAREEAFVSSKSVPRVVER